MGLLLLLLLLLAIVQLNLLQLAAHMNVMILLLYTMCNTQKNNVEGVVDKSVFVHFNQPTATAVDHQPSWFQHK